MGQSATADSLKSRPKAGAAQARRRRHERAASPYRGALESVTESCLWLDPASACVTDCNRAFLDLTSRAASEVVGKHLHELAPRSELGDRASAWHAIAQGEEVGGRTGLLASKSGAPIRVRASTFALAGGSSKKVLVVLRRCAPEAADDPAAPISPESQPNLAYAIAAAEARERQRIANGLHDDIGQTLSIIGLKLGELDHAGTPEEVRAKVRELLALNSQALRATRSATFDLSCPVLQQLGLQAAIEGLAQRLGGISGLTIHVRGQAPDADIAEPVASVLFRVVRELLMNSIKHARARNVWITMTCQEDELRIMVADDGVGFRADTLPREFGQEGGFGLLNVEAQMRAIGGRFAIIGSRGRGATAGIALPIGAS